MKKFKKTGLYILLFAGLVCLVTLGTLHHPAFGNDPSAERLLKMKNSPNYRDGQFHNLIETPMMTEDASYWRLIKMRFSGEEERVPQMALPTVKRDLKKPVADSLPQITWFGHSSLLVQLAGKNILVDPVFSKRTSPVQFIGPKNFPGTNFYDISDFPSIDFLLISHDHYDHLDYHTIREIAPKVGAFYVPLGVGAHLQKWGVPAAKITELDWWDEAKLTDDITLAATPARHFSGRGLTRNKTLWASFVLYTPGHRIFLGADSGYGPHFKQIGEKYGPFDLTLLESGQYHNYWRYIHMMPEETVQAHLDLRGKVLMPIHWGKFNLALHSWTEPIERLTAKAQELQVKVTTPMLGELLKVGKEQPVNAWWKKVSAVKN